MSSSYLGEPKLGNERSRKGKKSNSEKPKQPQRGLGVAQLEKIRLHSQMGTCTYLPSLHDPYPSNLSQEDMRLQAAYTSVPSSSSNGLHGHQNIMMGLGEFERANVDYGDSQPSTTARWNPSYGMLENQQFAQPSMTRHFMNPIVEKKKKNDQSNLMGSKSQNSETSDAREIDLELRLAL